jgi:hypothetical protein
MRGHKTGSAFFAFARLPTLIRTPAKAGDLHLPAQRARIDLR